MSNFLIDAISSVMRPGALSGVATQLGQSEQQVSRGLEMSVAGIGAGIANKSDDRGFVRQLFDLASTRGATGASATTDPTSMLASITGATTGPSSGVAGAGSQLLSSLFGGNSSNIAGAIAGATGLRPDSASSLLAMAGPLVLGAFGSQIRSGGLSAGGFSEWLASQRDNLLRDTPPALRSALGARDTTPPRTIEPPISSRPDPVYATSAARPTSSRWLWPLLAAVLVVGVLWNVLRGRTNNAPLIADSTVSSIRASTDTVAGEVGQTATAAAAGATAAVSNMASKLGAMVSRHLPNGTDLNVPDNGIESKLLAYLSGPAHHNDTTWFDFDRLTFETGSANLTPESQDQLKDVAAIFSSYPKVHATIGGYTDNTGDADANVKLSQDRAANVVSNLVSMGVAPNRLTAKGYGDAHPVGDNSTEEGRAENRRIAIRITQQ
jgi:outer membrane protein OmpA-like peptidoglycan-associated protein